jgi:catalase (peroxidase I)
MDASQEQTDVDSFAPLEPTADGLADLSLPRRLVSAVDLPRLLSNIANSLHRKEARQLDVLYGAG